MKFSAILPAAGTGSRTNLQDNKIFYPLGGIPILLHALRPFIYNDSIDTIVVVASQKDMDKVQTLLSTYAKCKIVLGGATRVESVYNGLQFLQKNAPCDFVLIHDAARPFLKKDFLEQILQATKKYASCVPILPPTDSVLTLQNGKYQRHFHRQNIGMVQTPQSFAFDKLLSAYSQLDLKDTTTLQNIFTDDSSIYAKFIAPPYMLTGDIKNKKITYIEDVQNLPQQMYSGIGQDVHRFCTSGNAIVLGGVTIPAKFALDAHSDGDVLVHAIMDALLSAAGLADIGQYFPNTDPTYKDCNSLTLLKEVYTLLQQKGFVVTHISASILAEHPKLAPYIAQMKENIASILQMEASKIGITVTTTEKLGAIGRGEGIFVTAIANIVTFLDEL